MKFSVFRIGSALLLAGGLILSGCAPVGQSQLDEEKEPHFLAGKNRVSTMDYKGAIESFEKALEANPKSASACLELGILFDQKEADPASAIFYYQRYLAFQPGAGNGEMVKQRILACKQELARTVSLGPVTQAQQAEIEKVVGENKRLAEDNQRLREAIEKWQAYFAARSAVTASVAVTAVVEHAVAPYQPAQQSITAASTQTVGAARAPRPVAISGSAARVHIVKSGETPAAIARRYGVRLEALMAANPGLDARRMRPGQALKVPGS